MKRRPICFSRVHMFLSCAHYYRAHIASNDEWVVGYTEGGL